MSTEPTSVARAVEPERPATKDVGGSRVARGPFGAVRDGVASFVGAVLAIVPHVLHHVGLLVGAAFLTGAVGNVLFYVLGLVLSVPMLLRLRRRFATWRAPAIAVVVFTAVFSFSAFVVGPAISGGAAPADPSSPPAETPSQHADHHGG